MMTEKEYQEMMDILDAQRKRVTATPETCRAFLESWNVLHLFVPKGSNEPYTFDESQPWPGE